MTTVASEKNDWRQVLRNSFSENCATDSSALKPLRFARNQAVKDNADAMMRPGRKPAENMPVMDTLAMIAYRIIGLLGGMRMPMVPPVAAAAPA